METSAFVRLTKIKTFLDGLLFKNSQIHPEILRKFLTILARIEEPDSKVRSLLSQWIRQAMTLWSATGLHPDTRVVSFFVKIASFLSKCEEEFRSLNTNNFLIALIDFSRKKCDKLSYLELLSSFLEHNSGIELMIAWNFWEDVLNFEFLNTSEPSFNATARFLAKVLEKTLEYDEHSCNEILERILRFFVRIIQESEDRCVKPTLKLIFSILLYFLEGIYFENKDFGVLFLFLKNFHLHVGVSSFAIISQSKSILFDFAKIMFIVQFLELHAKVITKTITPKNLNSTVSRIRNNFLSNIYKDSFEDVLDFCKFGLLYWRLMDSKIQSSQSNESVSDQLFCMFPTCHYCLVLKYCLPLFEMEELCVIDDIRDVFVGKFTKMLGDNTRLHFLWRDRLLISPNLFEICSNSFTFIKEYRKYLSKHQVVVTFQTLTYLTRDIVRGLTEFSQDIEIFRKEFRYLVQIFDLFCIFIDEFEITWTDSVETIDILNISFDFLGVTQWCTDIVVQVLTLINISIAKYMSPSLALLVDSTTDSAVTLLGAFLREKCNDVPEIKRAALEVVCTMASLTKGKFPSLQKVLMDSELPTLVVKMSACDSESFVRATAIKCLQEMIQVEEIWNNALKSEDLSQKMRDILINETEGIVRVEAATFMCVAYENQQLPKETLDKVYETMIYSSTTDLHWEVKVRALDFWDKVIKNHLQNQGMIDGSFPNVTFSKEHRKIVTLTDSEIRKRLLKVLSQLSAIGCLGVLMSAIKDDCDMEVSKTAVKITQRLVDLFKKYNVRSDSSAPTSPSPTENGTVSMSSGVSVDESMDSPASGNNNHHDLNEEIIDQIVNSKDVSLLKNVYTPSDYGSVSNYDIQVRKIVTPNEFLQFTQQDLNNIIAEKKKWLNGIEDLGSLLDDMLKTYDDDVNNMDCY